MDIKPLSDVELNNTEASRGSSPSEPTLLVRDDEVFIRMTPIERLQHITLILCFVLLVLTGLPLLLDPAMWLKKLFFFETSFAWRGWIHRSAGVGLIALSVFHLFYISCTQRGRDLFWALTPKLKDVTDALESFGYNLGVTRWLYEQGMLRSFLDQHPYWLFAQPPQYGRFNFIEKFEYLAVWWGNAVMIASGFFLWATNLSFRLFPLWVYDIFKIIHSYEAILAFLAIIIWHLYNVHLTPDVFPMSRVWLDGEISGRELRIHHPLEYEAIVETRRASSVHRDSEAQGKVMQVSSNENLDRKSGGQVMRLLKKEGNNDAPSHTRGHVDSDPGSLRGSPSAAKPVTTGHSDWQRRPCAAPCALWRAGSYRALGYPGCPGEEPGQKNPRRARGLRIALVGQPNCGKSTLFNSVAGYRSITANFPGVTVHYTRSRIQLHGEIAELIDLPGTYSLTASTPAESATRDFLLQEEIDAVINIIDASVLSRSLELTLQLLELGLPVVVCLNMMDEAHRKGIHIDSEQLAGELGVAVVGTVAAEGVGVHELFQTTLQLASNPAVPACGLRYHYDTETVITDLSAWLEPNLSDRHCLPPRLLAIKLLEGDEHLRGMASDAAQERTSAARQELAEARGRPAEEVIESERHALSMQLFESCACVTHAVKDPREQLDLLLTHKVWGYLFLGGMLAVFFGLVYGVGSLLEPPILRLFDQVTSAVARWFGTSGLAPTIATGLLQGLSGGVAIVLPYLVPFLIGMAILEDVGYLPRVAYLMDSLMHRIGLHGVAIVPAILGYGCNVPAVMATRILTSARDRFIAAVISTLVPCSARMTVIFGLVAFYLGPLWAMLIYAINIVVVACSGKLLSTLMPESSPGLVLEVPPYHLPKVRVVLSKTWLRLREFIIVAWPVLIAGSVLLSLAEHYHWDTVVNHTLAPFTALLGLPEVVGTTLIFGILRKELSMIMLMQALGTPNVLSVMTASQIVVFTLFVTFYIPCVATLAALVKETGWKLTAAVTAYSLLVATLIALAGRALPI